MTAYACQPFFTQTCCYLQEATIVHTLIPVSLQKQKSIPGPFQPFLFPQSKSPQGPYCPCPLIALLSTAVAGRMAPCDTTANIGISFLITRLSLKCHTGGRVCLQLASTASM